MVIAFSKVISVSDVNKYSNMAEDPEIKRYTLFKLIGMLLSWILSMYKMTESNEAKNGVNFIRYYCTAGNGMELFLIEEVKKKLAAEDVSVCKSIQF